MRPNKKTERNKEITELYTKGYISMKALGEQFGVSRERVRQILNQETGQPTKPRPKIQQELSPSDVEEILRKYSEGNSASSIGPSRAIRGILNTKGTGTRKQ